MKGVKMKVVKMESFPEGNPFWHDSISCGVMLRDVVPNDKLKGVYIMSSGMNSECDFYIVNSKNGERIGVKL